LFDHFLKSIQIAGNMYEEHDERKDKQRARIVSTQDQVNTSPPASSSPLYAEHPCLLFRQSGIVQCRAYKEKQGKISYQGQKYSSEKDPKRSKKEE
jgi:hypothetical protein